MRRIILFITVSVIFIACGVAKISKTINTYEELEEAGIKTEKQKIPLLQVKPVRGTQTKQTKGTTTIDLVPSLLTLGDKTILSNREIVFADPTKPGFDIYKVNETDHYELKPSNNSKYLFTISITNNSNQPFRLTDVLVTKQKGGDDGADWQADEFSDEWNKKMIPTKTKRDYRVDGINFDNIKEGDIFYFKIDGMPTAFDKAGNVAERKTFEWWFQCVADQALEKEIVRSLRYEPAPIESKQCSRCAGVGELSNWVTCKNCSGSGITTFLKVSSQCSKCKGTGKVHPVCPECKGKGVFYLPKSKPRPVKNSVVLNGWKVKIATKPSGANIQIIDPETGEYTVLEGTTPRTIQWLCKSGNRCPIIVESMGQKVKVLPIDEKGKESASIVIDFSKGSPIVKGGKIVE